MRTYLKQKRLEMGYTQKQLAKALGMATESYQRLELGTRNSSVEVWIKISDILNADLKKLYITTDKDVKVLVITKKEK